MAELTDAGLDTSTQAEILAAIEADQRAEISSRLDLSTASPWGQLNRILARAHRLLEEGLAALYMAMDPDSATGDALDRLSAITGTYRRAATKSTVTVTINVDPGTYAAGTLAAHVTGRPADRFVNAEDVTNAGGTAADVAVVFEAERPGPVQAPADSLTIAGAVSGWNSIVTHPDADVGSDAESDADLRLRRAREVANPGSTSTSGIAADISALAGAGITAVESVTIIENDTDATVDGIPPHSIEAIVYGPDSPTAADNLAVAKQIFESKAGGIGTYGNTSVNVTDSEGQVHSIKFTRPTTVDLTVVIAVDVQPSAYEGDTVLKEEIAKRAAEVYVPGYDAAGSQIAAWAHGVGGVLRVTSVTINGGAPFGTVAIDTRTKARIQTANITVNATPATP